MGASKTVSYMPILKAKLGEFLAWRNSKIAVRSLTQPIFEIVPNRDPASNLNTFVRRVSSNWPQGKVVTVDTSALDQSVVNGSADKPTMWIARVLRDHDIPVRPVVYLDDNADVLIDAAAIHQLHRHGICLRVRPTSKDPLVVTSSTTIPRHLMAIGFVPSDIDLLIDFQYVDNVQAIAPIATKIIQWAAATGNWKSVTVAAGAFPASISHLPAGTHTPLARHDASLWRNLVADDNLPIQLNYGDYGVTHPAVSAAIPFAPNPSLRYTYMDVWWVWREQRERPGNQSFYTLCERVIHSPAWVDEHFSWGDQQIYRCAKNIGGPGAATQWLAYGTSHHLATTTTRLATLGEP